VWGRLRNRILFVIVAVLIIVGFMVGVYYYSILPVPSASPSPSPTSTPTPSPSPWPPATWPQSVVGIEIAFREGFDFTEGEWGYESAVPFPVIRQGTSGNVTLTVASQEKKSINVSFNLFDSNGKELGGIKCEFNPAVLNLPAYGKAVSTLTLEVAEDAPSEFYLPGWGYLVEGLESGHTVGCPFLVLPYVPSCIFDADHALTPSKSWKPEIQIERGGKAYMLFYVLTEMSLALNLTYQSGELPEGIKAEITQQPLARTSSLLVTFTVDPETPEGIYEIIAKGSKNQKAFERTFQLKVISSE